MIISDTVVHALAPTGRLRAAINLGNPILVKRHAETGAVSGVSIDLATELARCLGVEVEFLVVETAAASVASVTDGRADVGFFAVDPLRGAGIAFTAPYVLIEGSYLVRQESPLQHNDEVDRVGQRVTVGKGSAYDLFLSRELKAAEIVRAPSSPEVIDVFLAQGLDVAAGVKQQLQADAQRLPGLRLLPGRFMVIQQAMGCGKDRGPEAATFLAGFVEDRKAGGFVTAALQRHRIEGVSVAPAL